MKNSFISINTVVDRLMRNPMFSDMQLEAAIDYTVQFLEIVGMDSCMISKFEDLEIKSYRCFLPNDFVREKQVVIDDTVASTSSDMNHMNYINNSKGRPNTITYKIENNVLYSSVENAKLNISYVAINVDSNGLPLIPSDAVFTRALESYIKVQHYTILFDLGRIQPAVLQNAESNYAWNVGQCTTNANRMNLADMELMVNALNRFLPEKGAFGNRFKYIGIREQIKNH